MLAWVVETLRFEETALVPDALGLERTGAGVTAPVVKAALVTVAESSPPLVSTMWK